MEWKRPRVILPLVPCILVLAFMFLQYQLIDFPRRMEFDLLMTEVKVLKQNVSQLQRRIREVQWNLPADAGKLKPKFRANPKSPLTKKCLEAYKSLLPVISRDGRTCRIFQFIHVAKNGGTALEEWLEDNELRCLFTKNSFVHSNMQTEFAERMQGTCYLTLVRDPVERWISGFLSRWRKGCPAHCSNWTRAEENIFKMFQTPDQLAEAFSSHDFSVRNAAHAAHADIDHLSKGYAANFPYGKIMLPHLIFAGITCNLEADALELLRAVGLPNEALVDLPPVKRVHANPVAYQYLQKQLSPVALQNIKHKVREDYEILRMMAEEHIIESENISSSCAKAARTHTTSPN